MLTLQNTKSLCRFYKAASGLALAAGCTKEFLDRHKGDVSKVHGPNGQALFSGAGILTNTTDPQNAPHMTFEAAGVGTSGILPGLLMLADTTLLEVGEIHDDVITIHDGWLREYTSTNISTDGNSNSVVEVYDVTDYADTSIAQVRDAEGTYIGNFDILQVDQDNSTVTLDDAGAVEAAFAGADIVIAPDSCNISVIAGGAFLSGGAALAQMDATYYDQWVFLGDDIVSTGQANFTSAHDGSIKNNTRLYMVGYKTNAYDSLPSGYGYWDETLFTVREHAQISVYRPAIQRARIGNNRTAQRAILCELSLAAPDHYSNFGILSGMENFFFMGFLFYTTNPTHAATYADQNTIGSLYIQHCTFLCDSVATGQYGLIRTDDVGNGGSVHDCFIYNGGAVTNATADSPTHAFAALYEIDYNCFERYNNTNNDRYSYLFHHNIVKIGNHGITIVNHGNGVAFNNVFYLSEDSGHGFSAFVHLNSSLGASATFFNNICCYSSAYLGYPDSALVRVSNGGTLKYFDYNLFYRLDGDHIIPDAFKVNGNGSTPDWQGEFGRDFGLNCIFDQNPQFMDPANWDFTLRPNSPCIGKGRPDSNGNPTNIGFIPKERVRSLYGRPISIYGN